ncbi:MAG: M56 family metallopeptidase [Bacteroidota bacterium]|nr:M56 family metallopeptidase [Bacteroidota bacterium]
MILYLLHVAFLIAICLIFYKLLLQKETFYRINRWVLLACMPLSFLLPLIRVPQQWSADPIHQMAVAKVIPDAPVILPEIENQTNIPPKPKPTVNKPLESKQTLNPAMQNVVPLKTPSFSENVGAWLKTLNTVLLMHWLFIIYITGVVIFTLNLLVQLAFTLYQAYTRPAIIDGAYRIVELSNDKVPCSFLNNIFINPEKYEWETYNLILLHEKIHARQLHSIDILLSELVIILQWFNPFAWWYRKELENNLEYLTDEAVTVKNDVDTSSYQLSLLQVSVPQFSLRIATNYNQSLLKKRILMMNAKRSNFHTMWKYFMLIPVFAGLVCTLNQPALSKNLTLVSNNQSLVDTAFKGDITGFWYANKEKDVLNMDMKIVINGKDMSYNGFTFLYRTLPNYL